MEGTNGTRGLAHDLRGRLTGVIGFAELIRDGKAGPVSLQQREFLDDIRASALVALDLVDGVHPAGSAGTSRAEQAKATASKPSEQGAPSLLVIEDDAPCRAMLATTLVEAGYAVETAASGAEAVARGRARRFDGITLDLLLPDMTGWDVVAALSEDGTNRDTPYVVVSSVPQKVAAGGLVIHEVVAKPSSPAELVAALTRAGVPASDGKVVVVIDNNEGALRLAAAVLRSGGYRPICRADGAGGLEAVAALAPAAVLVDLMMPVMNGIEFLERLRSTDAGRDTPAILWTAKDLSEGERAQISTLAQGVISKRTGGTRAIIETVGAYVSARG